MEVSYMNHFCSKCGAHLNSGVKFCASCGAAVPPVTEAKNAVPPKVPSVPAGKKKRPNWKLILPVIVAFVLLRNSPSAPIYGS